VVADNLPDEQIDGFRQMFDMMDKDKNGYLTFEELKDGFSMIGHVIPDTDIQMLIDAVSSLLYTTSIIYNDCNFCSTDTSDQRCA
jgi:Ca2+-binding EF-hand superfamily protein